MNYPTSLRELIRFLYINPEVIYTDIYGNKTEDEFVQEDEHGLWFRHTRDGVEHFLPVNCRLGAAAQSEGGLVFDEKGFTFTKFDRKTRVEYL